MTTYRSPSRRRLVSGPRHEYHKTCHTRRLPLIGLGLLIPLLATAGPAGAIEVIWTSPNTTCVINPDHAEFENPLTGTETVEGYQLLEWLDADFEWGPPRWYDDWEVSHPQQIDGCSSQIWMRSQGHRIWTAGTVPATIVSIHMVGDSNDGLADVKVDDALVAQLDMGTYGGESVFILVTDLPETPHTFEVLDMGTGQLGGWDVATYGAATLQEATRTVFTYQGKLRQGVLPVHGSADFEFTLFDAPATPPGIQIGSTLALSDQDVNNGLFTVKLDFGPAAFPGDGRWLEIAVRSPHDPTNTLPFTTLSPRQHVTPTPYAIYAETAGTGGNTLDQAYDQGGTGAGRVITADSGAVSIEGEDGLTVDGNVAVGTTNPNAKLHVEGEVKSVVGGHDFYMVPQGAIIMWSSPLSDIPDGWALCDGENGTPDLRDRFVYGWTDGIDPGDTGGSSSHFHTVDSHSHSVQIWADYYWRSLGGNHHLNWDLPVNVAADPWGGHNGIQWGGDPNASWTQSTLHGPDTAGNTGPKYEDILGVKGTTGNATPGTSSVSHIPPYYKLAFIMRL